MTGEMSGLQWGWSWAQMSDRKSEVTLVWTLDRMWWAEELETREQKTAMEWETRSAGALPVQKSEIKMG